MSLKNSQRCALILALLLLGSMTGQPALASEKLLERLERLDADLSASLQVAERAEPTLEALRKQLVSEALRIRNAKQVVDEIEARAELLEVSDKTIKRLRDELGDSAGSLTELKEMIEALEGIIGKTRKDLEGQIREAAAIRSQLEKASGRDEVQQLEEQLARAEALIAGQSATIRKLQAGGTSIAPEPPAPEPAPAPRNPATSVTLDKAFIQLQSGSIDQAQASFEALLAANPSLVDASIGLASCAFARGDLNRARELLDPLIEENQENPRALGLRGALLCSEEKYREARKVLEQAVEFDDRNPYYYNYLGVALKGLRKQKDAVEAINRAVELDPFYLAARYNLVVILATARRPDLETARIHYEQYIALGGKKNDYLEGLFAPAQEEAPEENP